MQTASDLLPLLTFFLLCGTSLASLSARLSLASTPPVARRRPAAPLVGAVPGEQRGGAGLLSPPAAVADDLHWLRDDARKDPAVLRHLELENVYSSAALGGAAELREAVLAELKARLVEADVSVPSPRGGFEYYTRNVAGSAYVVHCRRPRGGDGAAEQVLCDVNALAAGRELCDVHHVTTSPDHNTVAVGVDFTGGETYAVSFTAVGVGGHSARDELVDTSGDFVWGSDAGRDCFYLTLDAAHRPNRCWRHTLGRPQTSDELLFEERDERFWLALSRARSGAFVLLESASKLSSETHALPLRAGAAGVLRCLAPRRELVLYSAEHATAALDGSGGAWVIAANDGGAVNFRVCVAPLGAGSAAEWVEVLPHSAAVCIEGVSAFAEGLLISGRAGGAAQLWAAELPAEGGGTPLRLVRLPPREAVGVMRRVGGNAEHAGVHPRFSFASPRCPPCTCEVDLSAALAGAGADAEGAAWGVPHARLAPASAIAILKQRAAPNTDLAAYATARTWASAADGVKVPISLVWRPSAVGGGGGGGGVCAATVSGGDWLLPVAAGSGGAGEALPPAVAPPCLLYAYGSYGASMDMHFSSATLSLCDRGVVYAVAHVRGGGEMGRAWYEGVDGEGGGRLLTKKNTFSDYVACAEALLEKGWVARGRLAGMGASAGGLLMGVTLNTRPELFCAVLSCVGFVDVLLSVADPSVPLAVTEWEEWGNPNCAPFFEYIKSYSPLNNVARRAYPPTLLTAGLHDSRVPYWEPAKFAQRLRAATTGDPRVILLKTDMGAGHFSFTDRYAALRETAGEWAFLLTHLLKGA